MPPEVRAPIATLEHAGFADRGGNRGVPGMKDSDRQAKIVERSVGEAMTLHCKDGKALPPATSGRDLANQVQDAAWFAATRS